jgi:mRNA interferase RelE/StbE
MVQISFTDAAVDDLRRIGAEAVPKVLKKLLILLTDPKAGYPLGGELTGYRKLVVGRNTWRIVYRLIDGSAIEVCEVWAVGSRADAEVYAEAAARVREAAQRRPEFQRLADIVDRLGRLAEGITVEQPQPTAEPVPDWLAERLVHTVGIAREEVAAMTLQQAVDRWGAYMAQPKET